VRFANAPPVWLVDDRRDVAKRPEKYHDFEHLDGYDSAIERPVTRALELPRARRALGVNSLDEVPDSTWFTNRIGIRELTPREVGDGPATTESPELHMPWKVVSSKLGGGVARGLIVTDARGIKFMIKFDGDDEPETASATHVIVNRLLWACGYNVPEDRIVHFRVDDLVLAPHARVLAKDGSIDKPLTYDELFRGLAEVGRRGDGQIRALASRWVDGESIGGFAREGVRADDPNDRIPHEHRRDLRGEYPILSWVDHVDVSRGNSLDMWVADPAVPHRHYVMHYQIDFGLSFGGMGRNNLDLRNGHAYDVDYIQIGKQLVTFGLAPRRWGHHLAPPLRGVSPLFVADEFDPGEWHPTNPYTPFVAADRFDKLWGAKLVARFTPAQIRAAVDAAQLSDPLAADYITRTLIARQRAIVAYWFARTAPLDRFAIERRRLCFDDLAVGVLAPAERTHYTIAARDERGNRVAEAPALVADGRRTCTPQLVWNRYTIVELATRRPDFFGVTYLHVALDPRTAEPHVIGIWRM
jgi:hypothetical protein